MSVSAHLDCVLYLTGEDQARLTVAGRDYSGRPALDEALREDLREASIDPIRYGTLLFEALFPSAQHDDLLAGYREGLAIARHEEKRLRLRLAIANTAPAVLHDLHWELLYDPGKKLALSRSREIAFSRYLDVPSEALAAVEEKPRLLLVLSAPENQSEYGLPEVDWDEVRSTLEEAMRPLSGPVSWEFLEPPATAGQIRDRLVDGRFHAVHIYAHGLLSSDQGTADLVLETDDRKVALIDEHRFSGIFEGDRHLRLITLLACHGAAKPSADPFSGLARALVERGIPAVVAMRQRISVSAAARFTEHFFRNLARGGQVDVATNEARAQLHLSTKDELEWSTPMLFMRLADGRLWDVPAATATIPGKSPLPVNHLEIWEGLLPWIDSDDFIPFLGPDLLRGLLPSAEEIAAFWAARYGYNLSQDPDLPSIAQYVEMKAGPYIPHKKMLELLLRELLDREQIREQKRLKRLGLTEVIDKVAWRYFDRDEHEPHRILAELPVSTYVTTNYDSFMSAALAWKGKTPQRTSCIWNKDLHDLSSIEAYDDLEGTLDQPLVFHLYGNDLEPTSQVLTENNHFDFIRTISKDFHTSHSKIPSALRESLSESMLLFLGYNITDLNCRVLFRGLIAPLRGALGRLAVLQIEGDQHDEALLNELRFLNEKYCESINVKVYWGSAREFLKELHKHWKDEYGDE